MPFSLVFSFVFLFAKSNEKCFCEIVDDPWWFLDEFGCVFIRFPLLSERFEDFAGILGSRAPRWQWSRWRSLSLCFAEIVRRPPPKKPPYQLLGSSFGVSQQLITTDFFSRGPQQSRVKKTLHQTRCQFMMPRPCVNYNENAVLVSTQQVIASLCFFSRCLFQRFHEQIVCAQWDIS